MPGEPPTEAVMKALMTPEQFLEWKRQDDVRREFWRTLSGPAQRPLGSNADEWNLFLSENKDAIPYLAVQIAVARPNSAAVQNGNRRQSKWQVNGPSLNI